MSCCLYIWARKYVCCIEKHYKYAQFYSLTNGFDIIALYILKRNMQKSGDGSAAVAATVAVGVDAVFGRMLHGKLVLAISLQWCKLKA